MVRIDELSLNPLSKKETFSSFSTSESNTLDVTPSCVQGIFQELIITQEAVTISHKKIILTITPNNIFGVLIELNPHRTEYFLSTGILKLKATKKTIKFHLVEFLFEFHKEAKKFLQVGNSIILEIKAGKTLQEQVRTTLVEELKDYKLILIYKHLLSFNGCRAKKKKRKKRKGVVPVKFV